jgi:hypothetical protein
VGRGAEREGWEMRTIIHRNNLVTVWDVYAQSWIRRTPAGAIRGEVLASLPRAERDRVIRAQLRARLAGIPTDWEEVLRGQ